MTWGAPWVVERGRLSEHRPCRLKALEAQAPAFTKINKIEPAGSTRPWVQGPIPTCVGGEGNKPSI